jgi:cytochrome b561
MDGRARDDGAVTQTAYSTHPDADANRRYGAASIFLHWTIALLILIQLCLGWYMNEVLQDHSPAQAQIRTLHISLGLSILLLVLVRIGVRLAHRPPPLPRGMAPWERVLARSSHILFYLLLLILPLTGWTLVSLGSSPIKFWGLPWPHLPGVGVVFGSPAPKAVRHALSHLHVYTLIWVVLITLALHVIGALRHQFDRNAVLWRMTWLKPPATPSAG